MLNLQYPLGYLGLRLGGRDVTDVGPVRDVVCQVAVTNRANAVHVAMTAVERDPEFQLAIDQLPVRLFQWPHPTRHRVTEVQA
ncbi:hypothetical protein D3C84_923660 [compost metagenome]